MVMVMGDTSKSTAYTVGGPFDDKITGAIEGTGARSMDLTDIIRLKSNISIRNNRLNILSNNVRR